MGKMTEFDGMKVKTIPVIKSIEYETDEVESKKNKKLLEEMIVDMIVNYYKNK